MLLDAAAHPVILGSVEAAVPDEPWTFALLEMLFIRPPAPHALRAGELAQRSALAQPSLPLPAPADTAVQIPSSARRRSATPASTSGPTRGMK